VSETPSVIAERLEESEIQVCFIYPTCVWNILLPAGSAQRAALPVLFLLMGRFLGFCPTRSRWNLAGSSGLKSAPPCQISPWSVQGCGFTAPKTLKIWNFTNVIAPKWRVLCTILTKFIGFMHVLSLHKSAKFGWYSLINDKIINNLPRWGGFQPNFWWPLAAKLIIGPKKFVGWNDARFTSIIMQNLVEIEQRTSSWEDEV